MWFRIFLLTVTAFSWSFTIWMSTHTSENGDVLSRYSNEYFMVLAALLVVSIIFAVFQFGSAYSWIQSKRQNLTLLFFSIALSLGLAELMIRILDPIGISYYEHSRNYHLDKVADDEMYYRHRPNFERNYQGVPVQINAHGFRDKPISDKEPNELRIMFLGDSVTFGWGARQEDIFVHRTGELLEERLRRPVRTINTGVGSYNTDNQDAVLRHYGQMLAPDAVVLTYVSNDIDPTPEQKFDPWPDYVLRGKSPPEAIRLIAGRSWAYRLILHVAQFSSDAPEENLSRSSEGWKQSANALRSISEYCNTKGIPFIVIMYRMSPNQLVDGIARELSTMSAKLGFYYGDTLPWFDGQDIRQLTNTPVDRHPNAQGHALVAEGIVNLLQQNVFPGIDKSY